MLYATDGINTDDDFNKAMVGVGSVWCVSFLSSYPNSPPAGMKATRTRLLPLPRVCSPHIRCNKHLLGLGQEIKASLTSSGIIGYQFGTVGVSDGISMGTRGMSYSLQSRDLIADQVETAAGGHHLDGMVVVPGCDKNMPGVMIARASVFPSVFPHTHSCPISRPPQPPRSHGLRRHHPRGRVRRRATARYRLRVPVLR